MPEACQIAVWGTKTPIYRVLETVFCVWAAAIDRLRKCGWAEAHATVVGYDDGQVGLGKMNDSGQTARNERIC